jgi:hypothetical protein
MTVKPPKRPRDPNQLAKMIVDIATEQVSSEPKSRPGSVGGRRRAEALPETRRVEIARKGAQARWEKRESTSTD